MIIPVETLTLPKEPLYWLRPSDANWNDSTVSFSSDYNYLLLRAKPLPSRWTEFFVGQELGKIYCWYWPPYQQHELDTSWRDPELVALLRGQAPPNVVFDYLLEYGLKEVKAVAEMLLPHIASWDLNVVDLT